MLNKLFFFPAGLQIGHLIRYCKDKNQFVFKHSSRKLSLKDSIKGLSVGLPGRKKSNVTFLL